MILRLLFLLSIISFHLTYSQNLSKSALSKLGPRILKMYDVEKTLAKSAAEDEIFELSMRQTALKVDKEFRVTIRTTNPDELRKSGVKVNSVFSEFVTATINHSQIETISSLDYVTSISIGETYYPKNDVARGLTGVDLVHSGYINATSYTGSGVIVCIIDTGIDWAHLDFRDPTDDTQSRILYIWDQTITAAGSEVTPDGAHAEAAFDGFDNGVEYSKTDIEDEIDGSAANFVREEDTNGHGTHVAGSAAGNGASLTSYKYMGMAYEADIIVVKAGNGSFSSQNIIDGIAWAEAIGSIEGKPVVINMSLGGHSGAHDGTGTQEVAVDDFAGTGQVAVISAGNEGGDEIHISGTIANGASADITLDVTANTGSSSDYVGFDLWHDTSADITVTVTSPNSQSYSRTAAEVSGTSETTDGSIYIYNQADANYTNGDERNLVLLEDYTSGSTVHIASGTWTINIQNNSGSTRTYHGWLYTSSMTVTLNSGDNDYTVGIPGTASEAITVGSYSSRLNWTDNSSTARAASGNADDISSFSSIGPTRDGNQKPDITGPGEYIGSSTSSDYSPASAYILPGSYHHTNRGTSMSSPVVAGIAALLLEQNTSRTASECKSLLRDNADEDSYTGVSLPDYTWGYGKVNAFAAMSKAVNSSFTPSQETIVHDTWSSTGGVNVGNFPAAVEFTPSMTGMISGVFVHIHSGSSFSSYLTCAIYNDSSGEPGSSLGSMQVSESALLDYSWNYIDMIDAAVDVTSGTKYHVVVQGNDNNLILMDDNSGTATKSRYNNGSWTSHSSNLRIRPVVSTSPSELPVELVSFRGKYKKGKVYLNWQTATEVNNYGFEVERKVLKANIEDGKASGNSGQWVKIGFVNGHGNSNSPKKYSFVDEGALIGTSFLYRLKQIDTDGAFEYSPEVEVSIVTNEVVLAQNYPNPFNPSTSINYSIPTISSPDGKANVKLIVYDILGSEVATLVNTRMGAGNYSAQFDASLTNNELASGLYIYRLEVEGLFRKSNKMLFIK